MIFDFLFYLLGKITFFTGSIFTSSFPKPLKPEEERELVKRNRAGDKQARNELIEKNLRLVAHVSKKYSGAADPDDLISVGSIGLIKAVDTFDPEKSVSLATFAARCIENEILMLLRANKKYKCEVSLFEPLGSDKDGNETTLSEMLCEKEDSVFNKVDRSVANEKMVKAVKEILTDREFTVISLRYGLKGGRIYAQREVAKMLKISRSYISRIEKKAIEKLKSKLNKEQFYC